MSPRRWALATALVLSGATAVRADVFRPAYLELRQTSVGTYDVMWKVPAQGDLRLAIRVVFPPGTVNLTEPRGTFVGDGFVERWTIRCDGGLAGGRIRIDGLPGTIMDVLARVEREDGTSQVARLLPEQPSFVVESSTRATGVAWTYLGLGVHHILTGIDHLLYILGMLFLVKGWRRIVATMSAFTATHSLTLSAAALGWVHVPQPPVEACIALSIVFVAREIVQSGRGHPGLTARWPWVVSFTFGLMHGFGFAGALAQVGLPSRAIPVALLFFNVGVEIGQLLFVASVLALFAVLRKVPSTWPGRVEALAPYAIGAVAMIWVVQRIAAFASPQFEPAPVVYSRYDGVPPLQMGGHEVQGRVRQGDGRATVPGLRYQLGSDRTLRTPSVDIDNQVNRRQQ